MMEKASLLAQIVELRPGWREWLWFGVEVTVAAALGLIAHAVLAAVIARVTRRTPWGLDNVLQQWLRAPARLVIPLLFVMVARSRSRIGVGAGVALVDHILHLALIAALTWLVARFVSAFMAFVKLRHDIEVEDNREARRVHTQVTVIGRSLQVLAIIVGLAVALMTFPRVQQVGTSLLASAGIVGLAVGLAARPVLENLINGVQIGLAQPIRLDDVVVVDGEFGRVEEITLTYVVVKIWDERRLVLPFSKFITGSFQNWTRQSSQLLGTVFIWVDYSAPVERIRAEAKRIVESSPLWDQRTFSVLVTEATEQTMQLRVLVSAADAGKAFDLRVAVREQLIHFLQREIPTALPRSRVTLDDARPQTTADPAAADPAND